MSGGLEDDYRRRLAELIGEPVMVDDPLLTTAQVAALLGVSQERVRRLARAGHFPVHGTGARRLLLSEIARAGADRRMTVAEAGTVLGLQRAGVRRLIDAGLLRVHGSEFPLSSDEVAALAELRRSWVSLATAARHLHLEPEQVIEMLRNHTLTHTGDVSRPVRRRQLAALPATKSPGARSASRTGND